MNKCEVCGGTEFTKEEGFYYCNECQTRCKGAMEQVVGEVWADQSKFEIKTRIVSETTAVDDEYQWTTWEAYNIILKGMVDELIKLGASPDFKVVVLQLWVRYLQKIQAAFLGKGHSLPKLGPAFNPRDAKVVYSMSTNRTSQKKRKRGDDSVASSSISRARARSKAKKALVQSQYAQSVTTSKTSDTGSECSFSTSKSTRKDKYMTKDGIDFEKRERRKLPTASVTKLSRLKLLAILHLGLILSKDDIQLSDMLRWIREGHLSYYSVAHLLPSNMVIKGKDTFSFGLCRIFPTHTAVRKIAGNLALTLGISYIPLPDFPSLIQRYVQELELPEELAKFAVNLWAEHPPRMPFNRAMGPDFGSVVEEKRIRKKVLPNFEGRAMAILLFAMKLLFGLDGLTELKLSEFASKGNKILSLGDAQSREEMDVPKCKLFVWKEWVNYIEFRSALLTRFHFPVLATHDPEFVHLFRHQYDIIPPLPPSQMSFGYLKFLESSTKKNDHRNPAKTGPEWARFMKKELEEIINFYEEITHDEHDLVSWKPSITPQYSYFKDLQDNKMLQSIWSRERARGPCEQLFNSTMRCSSLGYLLNHTECIEALKKEGVSVTVIKGSSFCENDVKFVQPVNHNHVGKKNTLVEVKLIDDEGGQEEKLQLLDKAQRLELQKKSKLSKGKEQGRKSLKKKITKKKREKSKSKKEGLGDKTGSCTTKDVSKKHLKLFLPYRKIWMVYGSFYHLSESNFYYLSQKFPHSFYWLLQLSAKMLEMSDVSLYSELVDVELVHKSKKSSNVYLGNDIPKKEFKCENVYEQYRTSLAELDW